MILTEWDVIKAIGATEASSFSEFLSGLPDSPEDKEDYALLFRIVRRLEKDGQIEVSWSGKWIDSLILTEYGVETAKGIKS